MKFAKFVLLMMLVVLGVVGIVAQESGEGDPFFENEGILVIAHQGGDGLWPSNTLFAFENAVALGVDMLEIDIHSTQDGVLVVIHDDTVDRTTDGTGKVQDFTFAELQALDAGYDWPTLEGMDSSTHPYRGQGITIPALEDVLAAFPDMRMVIEIKQKEPSITQPLCEMLAAYDMTEKVLIGAFDADVLVEFREVCPGVRTSAGESEVTEFYFRSIGGTLDEYEVTAQALQVPEYSGNIQVVTPEFIEAARSLQLNVQVWTVNEADQMERMIALGVDGIITDFPDKLLEMLGRSAE